MMTMDFTKGIVGAAPHCTSDTRAGKKSRKQHKGEARWRSAKKEIFPTNENTI
jgi:hypothetical protein